MSVLEALVYLSVWRAVAEARGGSVDGYDARAFAAYFLALMIVHKLTLSSITGNFAHGVREGQIASQLLRPMHPLHFQYANLIPLRMMMGATMLPIGVLAIVLFDARLAPTAGHLAAACLVIPLASFQRALLDSLIGCLALWIVRIDGIRDVYLTLYIFLGGQFVPVSLLPETARTIAHALPFYWVLGYPTELLNGRGDLGDLPAGLAVLSGRTLAARLTLQAVWPRGTRALETVGS